MKITQIRICLLMLCSLAFWSCDKDEEQTVFTAGTPGSLRASTAAVVMEQGMEDDNAIAFTWTPADYGVRAAVSYSLELDKKGNSFAEPATVSVGNGYTHEFTVADFNALALQLGLEAGTAQEMEIRVKTEVAPSVTPLYSAPVTVTVTAFLSEPPYPTLYMVGPATEFNWDGAKGTPMFRNESDPFVYVFNGYLEKGELQVLGYLNQWGPIWGASPTPGKLDFRQASSDDLWKLWVPENGYYTFTMNLKDLTYSIVPYTGTTTTTYNTVGVTGAFNNWGNVAMTKTSQNPHVWSGDVTISADSEVKLSTPDWAASWGATGNWNSLYGKLMLGAGGNLWILKGDYRIYFNDLDGRYVMIKR